MHSADCIYTHTRTHIIMKVKVIYSRGSGATDRVEGNRGRMELVYQCTAVLLHELLRKLTNKQKHILMRKKHVRLQEQTQRINKEQILQKLTRNVWKEDGLFLKTLRTGIRYSVEMRMSSQKQLEKELETQKTCLKLNKMHPRNA